jgi:hypothetical protein
LPERAFRGAPFPVRLSQTQTAFQASEEGKYVSQVEKILKKVEQDRSKGNDDKALQRLKEALDREPRQYALAHEAAGICFQTGRSIEGISILRMAMKRCPANRPEALDLARTEFERQEALLHARYGSLA